MKSGFVVVMEMLVMCACHDQDHPCASVIKQSLQQLRQKCGTQYCFASCCLMQSGAMVPFRLTCYVHTDAASCLTVVTIGQLHCPTIPGIWCHDLCIKLAAGLASDNVLCQ